MSAKPTSIRITLPDHIGGTATVSDGCIEFDGARIGRVGISNLAEVVDHTINTIVGSVAHHVYFVNGGELHYVFNARGDLAELQTRAISATITADGTYLVGAYRAPPNP